MLVRLVLYTTLGLLCSGLGFAWNTTEFWCFLGLFWSAETLARQEGEAVGVSKVLSMHIMKIANLKHMVSRLEAGGDINHKDLIDELRKEDRDYDNKDKP
jgi:hypothetical protein